MNSGIIIDFWFVIYSLSLIINIEMWLLLENTFSRLNWIELNWIKVVKWMNDCIQLGPSWVRLASGLLFIWDHCSCYCCCSTVKGRWLAANTCDRLRCATYVALILPFFSFLLLSLPMCFNSLFNSHDDIIE